MRADKKSIVKTPLTKQRRSLSVHSHLGGGSHCDTPVLRRLVLVLSIKRRGKEVDGAARERTRLDGGQLFADRWGEGKQAVRARSRGDSSFPAGEEKRRDRARGCGGESEGV